MVSIIVRVTTLTCIFCIMVIALETIWLQKLLNGISGRFGASQFLVSHFALMNTIFYLSTNEFECLLKICLPPERGFAGFRKCLAAAIRIDIFPLITSPVVRATFISCQLLVVVPMTSRNQNVFIERKLTLL